MTAKQEEVIDRIRGLMREHFDGGIIIVEHDDEDEREIMWHGGISRGLGLCSIARVRLLERISAVGDKDDEQE